LEQVRSRLQKQNTVFEKLAGNGVTIIRNMALTLAVALLALVFITGYGLWQLTRSEARFASVEANTIPALIDLAEATAQMSDLRAATLSRAMTENPQLRAQRDQRIADAHRHLDDILVRYAHDHIVDDKDQAFLAADNANLAEYRSVQAKFIEQTSHALDDTQLDAALAPLTPATAAVVKGLKNQTDYNIAQAIALGARGERAATASVWTLALTALAVFALTGGLAWRLFNRVRHGLGGLQQTLGAVSHSLDLSLRAPVERRDEIGRTAEAFNQLIERVKDVLRAVQESSHSVRTAAAQIAAGNADLSSRTEEQAASLEETASSMEQLTTAVQHNADSSKQASTLTGSAAQLARKGHEVVVQVVDTMSEIDESSDRIAQITGIIEGIAFQTNILALNAAVEAARAGEQGRGFAVVAGEVRSLAQRASSAAKEIKDLIALSVQKIHAGSSLANEAGEAISHVTAAVGKVADVIGEIALASEEQSRGIEQVNRAIMQMDEVTQRNAALVEEAAAAARSLEDQGTGLDTAVNAFRLDAFARPAIQMLPT
jgi:methyl-accepting chemotaxis protein